MHRANSVQVLNGRQGIEETDGEAGVWLSIRRSLTALRRGSQDGDPNPQGSARSLRAALAMSHWTSWKEQELALRCYLPFPLLLPPLSRWEKTNGKPGYSDRKSGAPQEHPGEMPQSDKSAVQPQPARRPPEGGSSLSRLWRTARTQCSEHRNPGPAKDPGRKGGRRGCDPEGARCPQPDVCDGTGADPTRKQRAGGGADSLAIPATSFLGRGSSAASETAAAPKREDEEVEAGPPTAPPRPKGGCDMPPWASQFLGIYESRILIQVRSSLQSPGLRLRESPTYRGKRPVGPQAGQRRVGRVLGDGQGAGRAFGSRNRPSEPSEGSRRLSFVL